MFEKRSPLFGEMKEIGCGPKSGGKKLELTPRTVLSLTQPEKSATPPVINRPLCSAVSRRSHLLCNSSPWAFTSSFVTSTPTHPKRAVSLSRGLISGRSHNTHVQFILPTVAIVLFANIRHHRHRFSLRVSFHIFGDINSRDLPFAQTDGRPLKPWTRNNIELRERNSG